MKITVQTEYCKVTVEHGDDDLNIHEVFEYLVMPAFLAIGYSSETIMAMGEEYEL